MWKNW